MESLKRLQLLLARASDLNAAADLLEWDQETYMPDGAAEYRAFQIATLRETAHETATSDAVRRLLEEVQPGGPEAPDDAFGQDLVRVARRDFDRQVRIPARLVNELAAAVSRAQVAWRHAREDNSFSTFAPHLEQILALTAEKAERYGFADRAYDALIDDYEPEMTTSELEVVFERLRQFLVPLVHEIAARPEPDASFLSRPYDHRAQWDFGMMVARSMGFDFSRGRQDVSAHPFTTAFSPDDVRVTTRVNESYLPSALFGTMHEVGHALYEQGINPRYARTPLATGSSLGLHESQSRLWENIVGRSKNFWAYYFPRLRAAFPYTLGSIGLDDFYRGINQVKPSCIRVEADEVTYNLHIMLRFELELALLEGRVNVGELPDAWNERMVAYLGVLPKNDAEGVLQDVHWSIGAIGYFPTYTLGNLMSAQLARAINDDVPGFAPGMVQGDLHPLLEWLRQNVHRYGRARSAENILIDSTGERLSPEPWINYIGAKYGALYGLSDSVQPS